MICNKCGREMLDHFDEIFPANKVDEAAYFSDMMKCNLR